MIIPVTYASMLKGDPEGVTLRDLGRQNPHYRCSFCTSQPWLDLLRHATVLDRLVHGRLGNPIMKEGG